MASNPKLLCAAALAVALLLPGASSAADLEDFFTDLVVPLTDILYTGTMTSDALVNVRQLPSGGFVGTQLENVGEVSNKGH